MLMFFLIYFDSVSTNSRRLNWMQFVMNIITLSIPAFIDMPELLTYMRQNYIRWKELDEQGHTTLADIQKLQNTMLMTPIYPTKTTQKSDWSKLTRKYGNNILKLDWK